MFPYKTPPQAEIFWDLRYKSLENPLENRYFPPYLTLRIVKIFRLRRAIHQLVKKHTLSGVLELYDLPSSPIPVKQRGGYTTSLPLTFPQSESATSGAAAGAENFVF